VDDEEVQVLARGVDDLLRGVGEGDRDAGAGVRGESRGVLEPLDVPVEPVDDLVVDRTGQLLDLGIQVGGPLLEGVVLVGLAVCEGGQVGVAPRAKVGALAVGGTHHEQRPAEQYDGGGADPPPPPWAAGTLRGGVVRPRLGTLTHADYASPRPEVSLV
jgi:hypothetical protein